MSRLGRDQAASAARYLSGDRAVDMIVSSPLQRAIETASFIASALGLDVVVDERLTEGGLASRWAMVRWDDLPRLFPGELEAYLERPWDLPFSPEPLVDVADRQARVVDELGSLHPGATAVLVGHQDPLQALRLKLTGRPLTALNEDKPEHAAVIGLAGGTPWKEEEHWSPGGSEAFPPTGSGTSA